MSVAFESRRIEGLQDTRHGRYVIALLRVVCDRNDHVAHRLVFGLHPQVGPVICNSIAEQVISNNLNYKDIFWQPTPPKIFRGRILTAFNHARSIFALISTWQGSDTIDQRGVEIYSLIQSTFGQNEADEFQNEISNLPKALSLTELRDYFWADKDEQRASLLQMVYQRLGLPEPQGGFLPPQVRIMTMHGAKGLSAKVVFIPALEEEIMPGSYRRPYPGLVLEAARMLYVSITRARAACILSYAQTRVLYGKYSRQTPSRYNASLGSPFVPRATALGANEIGDIMKSCGNL